MLFVPDEPEVPVQPAIEQVETAPQETSTDNATPYEPSTSEANMPSMDSLRQVMAMEENQSRFGIFASAASGSNQELVLENELLTTIINTKGGTFASAVLTKNYRQFWGKEPISLWDPSQHSINLWLDVIGKGNINTGELYFEQANRYLDEGGDHLELRLNTSDPSSYLAFHYSLAPNSYSVDMTVEMVGLGGKVNFGTAPLIEWKSAGWHNEKGLEWERQHSAIFYREQGKGRDYLSEGRDDEETLEEPLNWVAFKQNYFSAILINPGSFKSGAILKNNLPLDEADTLHTMMYEARVPLDIQAGQSSTPLEWYFGPNDYKKLKALEVEEVDRIIDYGWWIFGWVNRTMVRPIFNWLYTYIGSVGLVIIILTFLIKLLLFPITWKNFLSSAKMRVLKPELDELTSKHKDPMEKQQAQMALYRQTGVSPFAGCLPTLLQMPILYAMFRFFPAHITLRGKEFLWADDLGAYDSILKLPFDIPLYGDHVSGFTLMMAVSTFFYTRMSSANMPTASQPGMPNMKVIMNLFPFMMLFFFNNFAAGLSFYYFIANVISILQMLAIKKYFVNEDKIRAKIEKNKQKPKKESSFQKRLQDMQKVQQEKTKNQKRKK